MLSTSLPTTTATTCEAQLAECNSATGVMCLGQLAPDCCGGGNSGRKKVYTHKRFDNKREQKNIFFKENPPEIDVSFEKQRKGHKKHIEQTVFMFEKHGKV